MEKKTFYFKVSETDEAVSARDLTYFLYLFNTAYNAFIKYHRTDAEKMKVVDEADLPIFRAYLRKLCFEYKFQDVFFLSESELEIKKIKKESPLEIWLCGVASALVVSVIISGGKVDLKNMTLEINSIGKGIKELREAFSLPARIQRDKEKAEEAARRQSALEDKDTLDNSSDGDVTS